MHILWFLILSTPLHSFPISPFSYLDLHCWFCRSQPLCREATAQLPHGLYVQDPWWSSLHSDKEEFSRIRETKHIVIYCSPELITKVKIAMIDVDEQYGNFTHWIQYILTMLTTSILAPRSKRSLTISRWPLEAAMYRALWPHCDARNICEYEYYIALWIRNEISLLHAGTAASSRTRRHCLT